MWKLFHLLDHAHCRPICHVEAGSACSDCGHMIDSQQCVLCALRVSEDAINISVEPTFSNFSHTITARNSSLYIYYKITYSQCLTGAFIVKASYSMCESDTRFSLVLD
jgi:hypothetical protein